MVRWYLRLVRERPYAAVALLFGSGIALSLAAVATLGARGWLVPTLLYLLFGSVVAWYLGIHFTRAAAYRRDWRIGGWAMAIVAIPLVAFAIFVSAQALMVAADLVLPFDTVDARVIGFQDHMAGRGPGSLHLIIVGGSEREMPAFETYSGPRIDGIYRLEVTRVEGLVVSVTPR